jgi:hypothetical protein
MMKTKSIVVAALFVLSAVVSAFANKPGEEYGLAIIPVKESEVFKIVYEGKNAGKVKLNIYNDKSDRIFSHSMGAKGFIQPLNFSGLEAGEYTVEIVNGTSRETRTINFKPRQLSSSYVHITQLNSEGKFLVSVARNKVANESITLNIFQDDKLIYNESNKLVDDFAKVYAVKSSGPVTIAVTDKNGKVTSKSF